MTLSRWAILLQLFLLAGNSTAQQGLLGTEINVRMQLSASGQPAEGLYDAQFLLFSSDTGGSLIATRTVHGIDVRDGSLAVPVDFGPGVFNGSPRFLETRVRPSGTQNFEVLTPRTPLRVVPYAETAMNLVGGAVPPLQACGAGQAIQGFDASGNVSCTPVSSDGTGGVRAGQQCSIGSVVSGFSEAGSVICEPAATGDITGVAASSGLLGGGSEGEVQLEVNMVEVQARISSGCPAGSAISRVNEDGSVTCEPIPAPQILQIAPGPGVRTSSSQGTVTVSADTSIVQARVSGSCPQGGAITQIGADGAVQCQSVPTDAVRSITPGLGAQATRTGDDVSIAVDPGTFQRRIGSGCSVGQAITAVNENGSVQCSAFGTSTITTISAGDGLSGGGASGIVTLSVDSQQYQRRIGTACPARHYIRAINEDGTPVCESIDAPLPAVIVSIVEESDIQGLMADDSDLIIGADGLPSIAYRYGLSFPGPASARLAKCLDLACTQATLTALSEARYGQFISATLSPNGFPLLAFSALPQGSPNVVQCTTATCSGRSPLSDIDASAVVGGWRTSIAVGSDGLPFVAYHDSGSNDTGFTQDLKFVKCANQDCSVTAQVLNLDSSGINGMHPDTLLGPDGTPLIAYFDSTNGRIKYIRCLQPDCSGSPAPMALTNPLTSSAWVDMEIGSDGYPLIAFTGGGNGRTNLIKCHDLNCDSRTQQEIAGIGGSDNQVMVSADGFPAVAFVTAGLQVQFVKCLDLSCANRSSPALIDSVSEEYISYLSLEKGSDGLPVMSYSVSHRPSRNASLRVAKCSSPTCN